MRGQMAHLDPEVLAEFDAGLITGRRGARIGTHLAACEQCTALGEQLAGVSALLMAVPAAAVPDHVADRLDTVLAAEIARRDQTEGAGTRDRGRRPRPSWHRNLRPLAQRVLAPAAVVALLVAGGYALTLGGGSSSSSAASSAARGPASAHPAGAAAGASSGKVAAPLVTAPAARSNRVSKAAFPVVTGTADFSPATFRQQVEATLRVPKKARQTQTASPAVRACVQALAGSATPVLVESARYQGQPATLIVLATGSSDTALLAGSRCSAADSDVLDRTTVPSGISGP